ncbi:hypothetical protein LTR70_009085 [Exophiala xenobiotica]|nr:hypothetical protein LTR70_009085 [Exophiala xenobiotica]
MALMFQQYGLAGLRKHLVDIARDMQRKYPGRASWDEFVEKTTKPGTVDLVYHYLSQMDQDMLGEVLKGTVMARYFRDTQFKKMVQKRHCKQNWPQVYTSISSRAEFGGQPSQVQEDVVLPEGGCGPSLEKMAKVVDVMGKYCDPQYMSSELLQGVDDAYPQLKVSGDKILGRKYLASKKGVKKVSFGERGHQRAVQHERHEATNYLFGLYTAVLKYLYGDEYCITTFALMDVMAPGHVNFVEILGSMISGSYMHDGGFGLNPNLAGGLSVGDGVRGLNRPQLKPLWQTAQKEALKKSVLDATESVEREKWAKAENRLKVVKGHDQVKKQIEMERIFIAEDERELEVLRGRVAKKESVRGASLEQLNEWSGELDEILADMA